MKSMSVPQQYLVTQVGTADRLQLVVMLYEGAVSFLKQAKEKPDATALNAWWTQVELWRSRNCLKYNRNSPIIKPQYVVEKLWEVTKGDAFVTSDVGQHQMWAAQFFQLRKPRSWASSSGLGTMGFGLPAAMGVQAAHPNALVVDIDGDGSFQMNIQELATLHCENLPVKVMLLNNQHHAPFEKFDYGLVVFSISAENTLGQTIQERWGGNPTALTPVQVAPDKNNVPDLIKSVRKPTQTLSFTAVGYGTGEKFPIPGQETGPANPSGSNTDKFLIRYVADNLMYNAHNPVNDVLRLSMNIAKGEDGTCNGDSGGPIFFEDQNLGRVQVSLVSGGDAVCRATNTGPGFRLSEPVDAGRASSAGPPRRRGNWGQTPNSTRKRNWGLTPIS